MRVAGIDPGTICTGIGILEQGKNGQFVLIHAETIREPVKKPLPERLRGIYGNLKETLTIYRPSVVAIENVFYSKDFNAAVKIGEARAVAMLAAMELGIPMEEYPPARVKEAICGNGRAHKSQVQFMVKQLLRLKELPQPDSADALAIAICHFHTSRWNSKKTGIAVN
ncbi:MAG: crossover junction endodeoxyribonuclease RuvC [Candidatus Omnitrophica bacterium]|nr:crossover junction endodeoxyribonuclease RuvC [Candidatus Omnitrophota bacterium]